MHQKLTLYCTVFSSDLGILHLMIFFKLSYLSFWL